MNFLTRVLLCASVVAAMALTVCGQANSPEASAAAQPSEAYLSWSAKQATETGKAWRADS